MTKMEEHVTLDSSIPLDSFSSHNMDIPSPCAHTVYSDTHKQRMWQGSTIYVQLVVI